MEPNRRLRAAREANGSPGLDGEPMSRSELAEAVNARLWERTGRRYALDAHTIARYERGTIRWPSAAYRSALRAVLRAETDADLGFQPTRRGRGGASCESVNDHEQVAVDRRDFLRGGLAGLAASTAIRHPAPSISPAACRAHLIAVQSADRAGGGNPVSCVVELLRHLEADMARSHGSDREDLLTIAARAGEFAGFLYRDLGDTRATRYWHDRAMEWAQRQQNLPMQAYVLLRKSQAAYDDRDAARMAELARAAQRFDGVVSLGLRAEIEQQIARSEAMLGARESDVRRRLDLARSLVHAADACGDENEPGGGYSEALLDVQTALCLNELGRPRAAADGMRSILVSRAGGERDRAYFQVLMATSLALCGEPDEAAAVACGALPTARAHGSRRTLREATYLSEILRPWGRRSGVRELDEMLKAASDSGSPG